MVSATPIKKSWIRPVNIGRGCGGKKEKEVKRTSLPNTLIVIVCVTEDSRPWPKGDGRKT